MNAEELAAQLGAWKDDQTRLYRGLAEQLRLLIRLGSLPPGSELPPERRLAVALAVSRTTIAQAYSLLKDEGWLVSLQGSGTRVAHAQPAVAPPADYGAAASGFIADVVRDRVRTVDLTVPSPPPGPWLMAAMSRLPALAAAALPGRVYEPAGYPALRDRIAGKLTADGRVTATEEVIVTNGATQALSLLAGVLTRRGDTVLVEELTCPTVLASLRTAGLRLVVVPIEREGADPQAVEAAVRRYEPSFIYVIPTYHNPTGWTMTERRRAALASIVRRYGVPLVEDLTLADTRIDGPLPPPPIAAYAPGAQIYTVGSLSKVCWPGLRTGWLIGPRRELQRIVHLRAMYDLGCPLPTQLLAVELLDDLPQIRRERQRELLGRRDTLLAALAEHLPQWRHESPHGGLSVWCATPRPLQQLNHVAQHHGMQLMLGSHFAVGARSYLDHVRLPFTLDEAELVEVVRRLAGYWAEAGRG
ncbi:PLP-dependent aminotransferase family protein [Micromonospora wenchangensis]|uniref:aminotransferase-like domain-containing protein n=1 Tax=Micromonospora wenchangensis TaxID=1185415 RepID=UPI003D71BB90